MTNPKKSKKKPLFLSWLQLKKERSRLLVAIAGISFADVLMFLQMGFRGALFSSAVEFHNSLNGEIVMVSSRSRSLISLDRCNGISRSLFAQCTTTPATYREDKNNELR